MTTTEIYTPNQIAKLGNTIIFLCERMKPITKTHLLKLVYILEETSVKKYGIPFFGFRFDLWKLGPVSRELFVDLSSDEPELLAGYITKQAGPNGQVNIVAAKAFNDDEFSDNELKLLDEVSNRFLYCTAKDLINFTHRKDTPWYNTALKNGLLETLEEGKINTTDIAIDLTEAIKDDEQKLARYQHHQEFSDFSRNFK